MQPTSFTVPTGASKSILMGFDFGTNTSCIIASHGAGTEVFFKKAIPTVVGYAKDTIISGVLEENKSVFFGAEALANRAHLNLIAPLKDGVIHHLQASKDFIEHIKAQLTGGASTKIKAVIGIPATTDDQAKENLQQVISGVFDEVMFVPEPFLAAMGYRNEKRLKETGYIDPVRHSLFIDIGAGTTDLCLVQGYYPTHNDLITSLFAGDRLDYLLAEGIKSQYPEVNLTLFQLRAIKEKFSYVGSVHKSIEVKVLIGGKARKIEIGTLIRDVCEQLLQEVFQYTVQIITQCPPESVEQMLQNIILTGGGSRIQNIATELQHLLTEEGFENPRVTSIGDNYKAFVGVGAWKLGLVAKDTQWQKLISKELHR
jgi:rod shape-determining protein MreB